jgi:hypothetical protein
MIVVYVKTKVSEEHAVSIFRVKVSRVRMKLGYTGQVVSNVVTEVHEGERRQNLLWANRGT